MPGGGCVVEDEVIPVRRDDFTDASDQVPVGGEFATGEEVLELGDQALAILPPCFPSSPQDREAGLAPGPAVKGKSRQND